MSYFHSEQETMTRVLLRLTSAVHCRRGAREPEEEREEDRQREKISIRLAASVPFSLSGADNLHFV